MAYEYNDLVGSELASGSVTLSGVTQTLLLSILSDLYPTSFTVDGDYPSASQQDSIDSMLSAARIELMTYVSVGNGGYMIGSIIEYAGGSIPDNYLACDGQAVSRTTYADLFTVIGTVYGVGDGSTTFNVPDYRYRAAIGQNSDNTTYPTTAIGDLLGSDYHTLVSGEMPSHTHNYVKSTGGSLYQRNGFNTVDYNNTGAWVNAADNKSGIGLTGNGDPHNNMQPSIVIRKLICYAAA